MRIDVDPQFVNHVAKNWSNEQTQEMIEAMVCELKKDCREVCRHYSSDEAEEILRHYSELEGQVQNEEFWHQMDHLLHFGFDF